MKEDINAAMKRAEDAVMNIVDDETGEVPFHNKPRFAGKIVVEVLIGFFKSEKINKVINEYRDGE